MAKKIIVFTMFILVCCAIITAILYKALEHEHKFVIDEAIEPTCSMNGLTEGMHCSICGEVLVKQKTVNKLEHSIVIDESKEATCTPGLTEGMHCEVCGEVLVAQDVISANSYHVVKTIPGKAATCSKTGLTEGKMCEVCGEILVAQEELPTTDHNYGEWKVTKEPTCTSLGYKQRECACGTVDVVSIPKLEHQFGEWIVITDSTCTTIGKKEQYCSCGEKIVQDIPNKHSFDNTGKCTVCGLVSIKMTEQQIESSKKIKSFSSSIYEYSNRISISINLKDNNYNKIQVPAYVDVKIVNDNGEVVYEKTLFKHASQNSVEVDYNDIILTNIEYGTIYCTIYNEIVRFESEGKTLSQLPCKGNIELPEIPLSITYYDWNNKVESVCEITNITYRIVGDDLYFYVEGEKTYDKEGNKHSSTCVIGWKLYDDEGYVVDYGTLYTTSLFTGEKFRNESDVASDCIEKGKKYTLVILNVSN